MKKTYKEIKDFMVEYFKTYTLYAQDAETMHKLNDYWSYNFTSTAYLELKGGEYPQKFSNRKNWQDFLIEGHMNIIEKLIAKEIIIDTDKKKVAVVLEIIKKDKITGGQLCRLDGFGLYDLFIDEDNTLKISKLDFYCGRPDKLAKLYNV